jgi:DNA-binding transcriptional regulator YiaG
MNVLKNVDIKFIHESLPLTQVDSATRFAVSVDTLRK